MILIYIIQIIMILMEILYNNYVIIKIINY